jgi:hypothetical protein
VSPIILDAMSSNQGPVEDSPTDHLPVELHRVIMIQSLRQRFDMEIDSIEAARIHRRDSLIYKPLLVAMSDLNVVEVVGMAAHIGDRMLNDCH